MAQNRKGGSGNLAQVIAEQRKHQKDRENTYREKALKLFPWICGRCGREFAGKKLKELTVHHKDHNHDNNPPDGGNWELLCIYCHENEHARDLVADAYGEEPAGSDDPGDGLTHRPFEALQALLKNSGKK